MCAFKFWSSGIDRAISDLCIDTRAAWYLSRGVRCAVLRLQLSNGTQQNLDGFMIQFNKNSHSIAPISQVPSLPCSPALLLFHSGAAWRAIMQLAPAHPCCHKQH